jgi:hypothetical protein
MEIEEYYNKNYLTQEYKFGKLISSINNNVINKCHSNIEYADSFKDNSEYDYRNIIAIPGKKWQSLRFSNLTNCSKIAVPGICAGCNTEQPFLVDIFEYFNRIQAAYGPYPCAIISGDCPGCGKFLGTGCYVLQLPYFVTPWANTALL